LKDLKGGITASSFWDMLELGKQAGSCIPMSVVFLPVRSGSDFSERRLFRATAKGAMAGGTAAERVFFYEQPGQISGRLRPFLKKGTGFWSRDPER